MYKKIQKPKTSPHTNHTSPLTGAQYIPNSAMLSMLEQSPGTSSLEEKLFSRLQSIHGSQLPGAEREADSIAASISPSASMDEVKSQLGTRLDADFSHVRVHMDAGAAGMADSIGAKAYTQGKDIYFGSGGYDARTAAHELVHTVQQGVVDGSGVMQSTPAGSIQMSPLDFFKKMGRKMKSLFSKGNGEERTTAQTSQADNEAKLAELHNLAGYLNARRLMSGRTAKDPKDIYDTREITDKDFLTRMEAFKTNMQSMSQDEGFLNLLTEKTKGAAEAFAPMYRQELSLHGDHSPSYQKLVKVCEAHGLNPNQFTSDDFQDNPDNQGVISQVMDEAFKEDFNGAPVSWDTANGVKGVRDRISQEEKAHSDEIAAENYVNIGLSDEALNYENYKFMLDAARGFSEKGSAFHQRTKYTGGAVSGTEHADFAKAIGSADNSLSSSRQKVTNTVRKQRAERLDGIVSGYELPETLAPAKPKRKWFKKR